MSTTGAKRRIFQGMRRSWSELSDRGLHLGAKWIGEQLYGMDPELHGCGEFEGDLDESEEHEEEELIVEEKISRRERDFIILAQSLILNGEYLRCAHMLRKQGDQPVSGGGMNMSPGAGGGSGTNLKVTSSHGLFLAAYSLYLAGEKLKEQQLAESEGVAEREAAKRASNIAGGGGGGGAGNLVRGGNKEADTGKAPSRNPFLTDIFKDLWPMYVRLREARTDAEECKTGEHENEIEGGLRAEFLTGEKVEKNTATSASTAPMDGYLLYMLALVVRALHKQGGVSAVFRACECTGEEELGGVPSAKELYVRSLQLVPYNWSCWLDLASLCVEGTEGRDGPSWEEIYPHSDAGDVSVVQEAGHWFMFQHFNAHLRLEQQDGEAANEAIDALASWFPFATTLTTYRALSLYVRRDYDEAQDAFEVARAADPHKLEHADTYSNILYVKERQADLSHLAHASTKIDKYAPETCCVVGNYYSLKGQHERAITYFQRALRVNPKFLSAWTLMGHECVELRNTAAAVQCYRNAVDLSPSDYRAWYGLGQTYEMLHLYQYALYYYKKATSLRPLDARMWTAVGSCLIRLGAKQEAKAVLERAVACVDSEGVATRELARLYREDGQADLAAQCYLRHLEAAGSIPLTGASGTGGVPHNMSPAAAGQKNTSMSGQSRSELSVDFGTALAQNGPRGQTGGQLVLDGERVEGVLFLANYFRSRGEYTRAESFCAQLVDFVGPEGDEARAIVRDIRSTILSKQTARGSGGGEEVINNEGTYNTRSNTEGRSFFGNSSQSRVSPSPHSLSHSHVMSPSVIEGDMTNLGNSHLSNSLGNSYSMSGDDSRMLGRLDESSDADLDDSMRED